MKQIWTYKIYLHKNNLPEGRLDGRRGSIRNFVYLVRACGLLVGRCRIELQKPFRPKTATLKPTELHAVVFFSFSITQHQPRGGREKLVPVASGIRTHTEQILSLLPLPLGYRDLWKGTLIPFQHNYYIGNCGESQVSTYSIQS